MTDTQVTQDEAELRAWDWRAALRADDRTIPWLARQTDRAQRTVYGYAYGTATPPLEWLQAAARVLRKDDAA
jgi:hypothetical protein